MAQMLTAKQVAEIKGCSYQYVKKILKDGKQRCTRGTNKIKKKR